MIVFEGPDNAGKSTIAKLVARTFDIPYQTAGPAPKNESEKISCLLSQLGLSGSIVVQDRLTAISQRVYSDASNRRLEEECLRIMINVPRFIVVYCRPPERTLMDFSTHKVKSYDTEESLSKIVSNQHIYIQRYDELMKRIPHIQYDWTDDQVDKLKFADRLVQTQHSNDYWVDFRHQLTVTGLPV